MAKIKAVLAGCAMVLLLFSAAGTAAATAAPSMTDDQPCCSPTP